MIPWEREIYLALLQDHIQRENEQIQAAKRANNRRRRLWLKDKTTAEMKLK